MPAKQLAVLTLFMITSAAHATSIVANRDDVSASHQLSAGSCARAVMEKAIRLMPEFKKQKISIAALPYTFLEEDGTSRYEIPTGDWRLGVEGENRESETLHFTILANVGSERMHGDLNLSFEMTNHEISCHAKTSWDGRPLKSDVGIDLFRINDEVTPVLSLTAGPDFLE